MTLTMLEQFKAARRAGTPLMAIRTFDPEALMQSIQKLNDKTPIIAWDCRRGWVFRNELGQKAMEKALNGEPNEITLNYFAHLELAARLPFNPDATTAINPILFVLNPRPYFGEPDFVQALWNLRDEFKDNLRSVVLLGPSFDLPAELRQDVLVLDEPLPTESELREIILRVTKTNGVELEEDLLTRAVDALRGLAAFPAEQAVAMSLSREGLNVESLWERKRQMISQYKGLTVWREGNSFDQLGGLEAVKGKFRRIIAGRQPPRVIVLVDEGEKQAGMTKNAGGDMSGSSSDQQATILSEIVDKDYTGAVFDGVPGGGKSEFAKAVGNEAGILTIRLDLGGSKGEGLVGQAENEIRNNLKAIEAIGGKGGAFFIITTNNSQAMDSAMKSRLSNGTWFFDLPNRKEKDTIWNIYLKKYPEVDPKQERPDDDVWTGREIRACVKMAWAEKISLLESATSIIPVAKSDKAEIEAMRERASGRFSSASYEGPYNRERKAVAAPETRGRKIAKEE